MNPRPTIFVGSSSEGLKYAKALQVNLDVSCEVVVWSQGVFGLSGGTLDELVERLRTVDFSVLVVTPDDTIDSRGKVQPSPRDNVLLELGICIGMLGRERTFLVHDRSHEIKLPTDLAGVTKASFQPHSDGNASASIGAASTLIEQRITELGERPKYGIAGVIDEGTQFRVIADLLGPVANNFLIQMYEGSQSLVRERTSSILNLGNLWYGIQVSNTRSSSGRFSVDQLCEKLPDAGLLSQDLKFNVGLTERGKSFVQWMIRQGYKAPSFITPLGQWGELSKFLKDTAEKYGEET